MNNQSLKLLFMCLCQTTIELFERKTTTQCCTRRYFDSIYFVLADKCLHLSASSEFVCRHEQPGVACLR